MRVKKALDLNRLEDELAAAGVEIRALGSAGRIEDDDLDVFTYDENGAIVDLPAEAAAVIAAHVAPEPPAPIDFGQDTQPADRLAEAVTSLRAYLGKNPPSGAETVAQVKLLTRVVLFNLRRGQP